MKYVWALMQILIAICFSSALVAGNMDPLATALGVLFVVVCVLTASHLIRTPKVEYRDGEL